MTMHKPSLCLATVALLLSSVAQAQEPEAAPDAAAEGPAEAPQPVEASTSVTLAPTPREKPADGTPWIKRYRPTRNMFEAGLYGGVLLPAKDHELYLPTETWQPYARVAPDIGLRFGYLPLSFLGIEIEGGVAPTKTEDGGGALLGMFRGHLLAQLPYRIAPFVVVGIGMLGTTALGKDVDPALHFGGGVKFYINNLLALRLDLRDNVSTARGVEAGRTHHPEFLLGLSVTLGRKKPVEKPVDSDGDGFLDKDDACPTVPGVAPDGCPAPELDSDGDGFLDKDDACPTVPGVAPDGCPPVDGDRDGDGFLDSVDKCPDVAGVDPDGCPPPDSDGDGIIDANDKCPNDPETFNNYQDEDGCPDTLPTEVQKFTGVIQGIFFDVDKDVVKPNSRKTLDNAAKVLAEFPDTKLEISGHTDSDGDHDHNVDLSRRRADAVKKYLVDKGIDAGRITTRGAGPDEPISDNTTKAGKAKNRRIEFKLR